MTVRLPAWKRLLDVLGSGLGLVVLSPLLLLLALLVRVSMGPGVLFRQERPGLAGRPFTILKFRTMRPTMGEQESDGVRLTPVGRWLRRTSLDELPELLNVLRGDMSLVGPRPLLMEYLPLYSAEEFRRHEVRPGITGWAQVNGRNAVEWRQKFRFDVWYVDHMSMWLDCRILARTLGNVFLQRGISQPGHATAEPFRGRGAS